MFTYLEDCVMMSLLISSYMLRSEYFEKRFDDDRCDSSV